MTEEEAKTKWCPFARVVAGKLIGTKDSGIDIGSPVHNRIAIEGERIHLPAATLCIGSACMAWQWEAKVDVWLIVKVRVNSRSEGFCGLAGKP